MSDDQPSKAFVVVKKKGGIHLWHATLYTLSGLKVMLRETAFRHELLVACLVFPAAWLLPLPFSLALLLCLCWLAVLVVEVLNTSLEAVVDLVSPQYHDLAKRAKDLGSAAVGLSIAINVFAWIMTIVAILRKTS